MLVEADLHEVYGIDTGDHALMQARSWRWLTGRIVCLMGAERSRLRRIKYPPEQGKK